MAKQAKTGLELDRISNLPDEIASHIVSFLDTKDAVCTCVLSKRWRHVFGSMSKFHIHDQLILKHDRKAYDIPIIQQFMNFVDRLLFSPPKATLDCLRLDLEEYLIDNSRVYDWIRAALSRGVKELELNINSDFVAAMIPADVLFTSKSLVKLTLFCHELEYLDATTKICFPNLKTLHLYVVFSHNDTIKRLFSACIVLEELVIEQCFMGITELHISNPSLKRLKFVDPPEKYEVDYSVVINAPSLVYFKYVDAISKQGYSITNLSSLVKADVALFSLASSSSYEDDHKLAAKQLLQGIRNVKSLHLTIERPNQLLEYCRREPKLVFPNLVELEIVEENRHKESSPWKGTWLIEFMQCSPNLTSILISLESEQGGSWSPLEEVPYCLQHNLKEIKLLKFNGDGRFLRMITYFLMNATVLERLTICMNGLKELLKIPRSSDKCQVLFE